MIVDTKIELCKSETPSGDTNLRFQLVIFADKIISKKFMFNPNEEKLVKQILQDMLEAVLTQFDLLERDKIIEEFNKITKINEIRLTP